MHLSDTLSQVPSSLMIQQAEEEDSSDLMTVNWISSSSLEELRKHTSNDVAL